MTDYRFHDIVIESHSMIGPDGEYHTSVCRSCSKRHEVYTDEFQMSDLYTMTDSGEFEPANALEHRDNYKEIMEYVSEMRAWNCCHEGEDPIDGLPEAPDSGRVNFGE